MVAIGRGESDEHSDASRGSRVGRALVVTVTAVAGIALLSCSATQPSAVGCDKGRRLHRGGSRVRRAGASCNAESYKLLKGVAEALNPIS
jgi:hypothetical protein